MIKKKNDRTAKRSCVRFAIFRYLRPYGFWTVEDVIYIFGLIVLLGGLAAAGFYLIAPGTFRKILLPCPIHLFFGVYCPGCGGTRALRYLLHGDIKDSVFYHPVVFYLFCVGGWFMISQSVWRCRGNRRQSRRKIHLWPMEYRNVYLYILIALYVLNFLWKNIALLVFHVRVIA